MHVSFWILFVDKFFFICTLIHIIFCIDLYLNMQSAIHKKLKSTHMNRTQINPNTWWNDYQLKEPLIKILLRKIKKIYLPINTPINTNIICIVENDLQYAIWNRNVNPAPSKHAFNFTLSGPPNSAALLFRRPSAIRWKHNNVNYRILWFPNHFQNEAGKFLGKLHNFRMIIATPWWTTTPKASIVEHHPINHPSILPLRNLV